MTLNDKPIAKAPIPLVAPVIHIALEGGLIPIEHLNTPIAVDFPVWPAAQPGYTYQLHFDGLPASASKPIKDTDKPGDILKLEIPVHLLAEGSHSVSYRTYSPTTDVEDFSDPTTIQIDRTAPGAPDLGPILFPNAIQDGLTSDELTAMNDVLPARIAGYTGMFAGDVIRTYWADVAGPQVTVDANDMGLKRVMVDYPRAFLEGIGDGREEVYYTVTDLAGNLSMKSEVVQVQLKLSVVTPLPLPTLQEAINDTLDPANTPNGATVVIDASASLRQGDQVTVSFTGPKGSDEKEKFIGAGDVGKTLSVVFSSALVTANEGEYISVSYRVTRANGTVQDSGPYTVQVLSAWSVLPAPTIDTVGADGVLNPGLIPAAGATVFVNYDRRDGDRVKVVWVGASRHETDEQTVSGNTRLSFVVPKSYINLTMGREGIATYEVSRGGTRKQSAALKVQVLNALSLDTTPVTLAGKVYMIPGRTDILPAFPSGTTVHRAATGGRPPYTYRSSNPAVAHVANNGLTSVRDRGTATISVTDAAGQRLEYKVTVTGVIACVGFGSGKFDAVNAAVTGARCRLPSIQQLREIHATYGNRWPMGNGNYWSSTPAKVTPFGKTYYVKNLVGGGELDAYTYSNVLGVGIR